VYKLDGTAHDPSNKIGAFEKAQEWGDRIPIGVIWRQQRPTFEEQLPGLKKGPLARQRLDPRHIEKLLDEFL
jgi:2-oxoglutarate ferredoxin oxidoreductase subunit beta